MMVYWPKHVADCMRKKFTLDCICIAFLINDSVILPINDSVILPINDSVILPIND